MNTMTDSKKAEWAGPSRHYRNCAGGRHWGPNGAAGALSWTTGRDGNTYVLLAKRNAHVQQGNTWAFPGGAIDKGENALEAACREFGEEVVGATPDTLTATVEAPCPHGCGWAYTTFVVKCLNPAETTANGRQANVPKVAVAAGHSAWETDVVAWLPIGYVEELPLHPAFAAAWPTLRQLIERAS